MFKKIFSLTLLSFMAISTILSAGVEYKIQDIGTLQTKASEAIALNNQGQILGWYNIDGTKEGKHFFVREKSGEFYELPSRENGVGVEINWRFLTNDGKAYGTFDGNSNYTILYVWDQKGDVVRLGNLPGKDVVKVNDVGQVLIKSIVEVENGKSIRRPVIWQNGQITKLKGSGGDLGIESEESYGLDMNNKGEVVGKSFVYLSYKNEIYKQVHAVKWVDGKTIDIHKILPKTTSSYAFTINDLGEFLIYGDFCGSYISKEDGEIYPCGLNDLKMTNTNYMYTTSKHGHSGVHDKNLTKLVDNSSISNKIVHNNDSIWMSVVGIVSANDNGDIIVQAKTIYGEEHAMLLVPVKLD